MVRLLAGRIHEGRFTKQVLDRFEPLVSRALKQYLNDQVNERLKTALDSSDSPQAEEQLEEEGKAEETNDDGIVTTAEELQGYSITRAIGCSVVDVKRIAMRDAKSYCAILFDDNNRRPIVRLYFNNLKNKKIGFFDADGEMQMVAIDEVSDIYKHAEKIRARIEALLEK